MLQQFQHVKQHVNSNSTATSPGCRRKISFKDSCDRCLLEYEALVPRQATESNCGDSVYFSVNTKCCRNDVDDSSQQLESLRQRLRREISSDRLPMTPSTVGPSCQLPAYYVTFPSRTKPSKRSFSADTGPAAAHTVYSEGPSSSSGFSCGATATAVPKQQATTTMLNACSWHMGLLSSNILIVDLGAF